jgi:hypothetical protein
MPAGPLYRITVRPEGPGPPPEIRLRNFLRGLLRRAGLRAVQVVDAADEATEVERLQGIIRSLTERVARQAEVLERRAEGQKDVRR